MFVCTDRGGKRKRKREETNKKNTGKEASKTVITVKLRYLRDRKESDKLSSFNFHYIKGYS